MCVTPSSRALGNNASVPLLMEKSTNFSVRHSRNPRLVNIISVSHHPSTHPSVCPSVYPYIHLATFHSTNTHFLSHPPLLLSFLLMLSISNWPVSLASCLGSSLCSMGGVEAVAPLLCLSHPSLFLKCSLLPINCPPSGSHFLLLFSLWGIHFTALFLASVAH